MTSYNKPQNIIALVDDDKQIRESFENAFEDENLDIQFLFFENFYDFETKINRNPHLLKAVIFDLAISSREEQTKKFESEKYIDENYDKNRIPIFIHSAYLSYYEKFPDKGTLFKVPKNKDSISLIVSSIKLMSESGFLNIFSPNGIIENYFIDALHNAFVNQFKSNEIEEIIKSVQSSNTSQFQERTEEIFKRIAIRALYQDVNGARLQDDGTIKDIEVNSSEHYYRRTSDFKFWTGDIFKNKIKNTYVVILTPRCNIGHENFNEILLCHVSPITDENLKAFQSRKGERNFRKVITDDVTSQLIGEKARFLPPTPRFKGGFVNLNSHFTLPKDELSEKYQYDISLVDDLTNDIVRKLTSYLLRGGISETEMSEAVYYLNR